MILKIEHLPVSCVCASLLLLTNESFFKLYGASMDLKPGASTIRTPVRVKCCPVNTNPEVHYVLPLSARVPEPHWLNQKHEDE